MSIINLLLRKSVIGLMIACAFSLEASAQATRKANIIPLPVSLQEKDGYFMINPGTKLMANSPSEKQTAELFNEYFKSISGYALPIVATATNNVIILRTQQQSPAEGYRISSSPNAITVTGNDDAGTFYGMQTVMQLVPVEKSKNYALPLVTVEDYPRFQYRGLHLDVCRHFFPVSFVKKYIDLLAMHKMNTFHWHLTDDQGWRIEIKKYPKLQSIASRRKTSMVGRYADNKFDGKPYGGYYTQEEVKDVVKYAAARQVTVIPEIEMPGHALAALAAYPSLGCTGGPYEVGTKWGVFDDVFCAGNDSVFAFLQDVLDEVMPLFPGKYVHIGGDECPKTRWKECPKCQARIKAEGLKDEHALQSYFIQRMEKYINSKGKKIIGWDEILEGGLAPNATVMSWRGMEGGTEAAKQHHDVIMTPGSHVYFDHYQSKDKSEPIAIGGFTPVSKVYSFEPVPASLSETEKQYIIGAQANLWSEYILTPEQVEYMVYPRATALSEVLWSPEGKRDYDDFLNRLKVHLKRLDVKHVNYAKHVFGIVSKVENKADGQVSVSLDTKLDGGVIRYTLDGKEPTPRSPIYKKPIQISKDMDIWAKVFQGQKAFGSGYHQDFIYHKALGKKTTLLTQPSEKYMADGAFTLVNGIKGNEEHASGAWLGYAGKNMEAVIDLGKEMPVKEVSCRSLQNPSQWIWAGKKITIGLSTDGKNFNNRTTEGSFGGKLIGEMKLHYQPGASARYVKIVLENAGKIPSGNPGAGEDSWLFVDEIVVR